MMDDLDKGLINCIICKDCSRFGRYYIECGSYVREFDDCNVLFIAINDNYDSFDQNRDDTIFAIKNVINTEYSKAKSRDIKKIFKEKQYEEEENAIRSMQDTIISQQKNAIESNLKFPWLERLLQKGKIEELDRGTVADTIDAIFVSDNKEIKIVYRFSDELETLIS